MLGVLRLWAVDRGRDSHRPRTHWGSAQEGRGLGEEWARVVAASPSHPSYEDGRTELLVLAWPCGWSQCSLRGKPSGPKRSNCLPCSLLAWFSGRCSDFLTIGIWPTGTITRPHCRRVRALSLKSVGLEIAVSTPPELVTNPDSQASPVPGPRICI